MENNIQAYRKKLGLSQEELGERLFVSRQTVSQWETGQTQPTLDNLIRLREIFGVSIDELMGVAEPECETLPEPSLEPNPPKKLETEQYIVEYSGAEVREVCNAKTEKSIAMILLSATLAVLSFMWSLNVYHGAFFLIICGAFLMGVMFGIAWLIDCRRVIERAVCRMNGKKYCFSMVNGSIKLLIVDDDKIVVERFIELYDIKRVRETRTFIVFECHDGAIYALRRSRITDIPELAVLYSALKSLENYKPRPKSPALRRWGIVFFALTLASLAIGYVLALAIAFSFDKSETHDFLEAFWGFFAVIPIPIVSIVIGIMLEKRDMPYKKNIVVAIIMIPVLILCGSLCLLAEPIYSPDPIVTVEEQLEIDIPADVYFTELRQYNQVIVYTTLSEADAEAFEKQLDDRWLTDLPEGQERLHLAELTEMEFDRVLLYNLITEEYNTLPADSGEYTFIALYYDALINEITIAQYDIEY